MIFFLLRAVFGSAVSALFLSVIVYLLLLILPKPERLLWQFVAGAVYLIIFILLAHFAYFLSGYSCPSLPDVPNWEVECPSVPLGDAVSLSVVSTAVLAPYLLLFYSAAFFVYHRVPFKSVFARIYLAVFTFLVVMLVWVAVFPWSLERYLQLFY